MTRDSILCADLGNSRIHLAMFPPGRKIESLPRCADAIVYCSVSPSRERAFEASCRRRLNRRPLKLGRDLAIPVRARWKAGADRLCNALAGFSWAGGACVVVDLGTAINVEAVSCRGELVGGLIAPGRILMARALEDHTELLPRVEPGRASLGTDTKTNIQGGIDAAVEGLIEEAIRRARRKVGRRAPVIGTGGDVSRFARSFDRVDPLLTLRGVYLSFALR